MGAPRWSFSEFVSIYVFQLFFALVVIGAQTAICAVVGIWYDFTYNGESIPPALAGLAAGAVIQLLMQLAMLVVLSALAYSRVSHAGCNSCGRCYCCHSCNSSSDVWFWLYWLSYRSGGTSKCTSASKSKSKSKSGDKDGTMMIAAIALAVLFLWFVLIAVTSAMLTSELFYWRAKNHFEVYGDESDGEPMPPFDVPADEIAS